MSGIRELGQLLSSMSPKLHAEDYVFCTVADMSFNYSKLKPLATFKEAEGLTLVLTEQSANQAALSFAGVFKCITLTVHSSLDAVGLTAAVANALAEAGISANVIAAFYHDHIFVPKEKADDALFALEALSRKAQ